MFITRTINNEVWPDILVEPIVKFIKQGVVSGYYEASQAVVEHDYRDDLGNLLFGEGQIIDLTASEIEQAESACYEYDKEHFNREVREAM